MTAQIKEPRVLLLEPAESRTAFSQVTAAGTGVTDRRGAVGVTDVGSEETQLLSDLSAAALRTGNLGIQTHEQLKIVSAGGALIFKNRHLFWHLAQLQDYRSPVRVMGMYHGERTTGTQDCQGHVGPASVHSSDIPSMLSSPDPNNKFKWDIRRG